MLKLKEIHIKNFKSLRDCKLELRNFNVLVGANASGKTNLVDLFLLLRKIYVEKDINPFRYWWGYQNAVWNRREELDISVRFVFEYVDDKGKTYDISFETTFTGRGGRFEILREVLEIEGLLSLELIGRILKIEFDEKWRENFKSIVKKLIRGKSKYTKKLLEVVDTKRLEIKPIDVDAKSLFQLEFLEYQEYRPKLYTIQIIDRTKSKVLFDALKGLIPTPFKFESYEEKIGLNNILNEILTFFSRVLILKLNINEIKRPSPLKREHWLLEDGSNLNAVLYTFNQIPDRITTILSYLFPNINIDFALTDDQRVYLKVQENCLELPPVCIADGLYKLLAILTALELNPSLLIVDEIENTLHPKTLEMLLDELKSSDTTVIVTTHSPVVVDMIEPEDLVIVEKIAGETKFRRIENPEEIKKKLREAGITFSEGWLYGEI